MSETSSERIADRIGALVARSREPKRTAGDERYRDLAEANVLVQSRIADALDTLAAESVARSQRETAPARVARSRFPVQSLASKDEPKAAWNFDSLVEEFDNAYREATKMNWEGATTGKGENVVAPTRYALRHLFEVIGVSVE